MIASPRAYSRVYIEYSLCRPDGFKTPTNQNKTWFFETPAGRDRAWWLELINRVFFDENVRLRRREPGDSAWLNVEVVEPETIDVGGIADWDGDTASDLFPWIEAQRRVVWESAACYFVADDARYDILSPHDFTELIMNRLLSLKRVDEAGFVSFFDKYFPSATPPPGRELYDERATRLSNLVAIRDDPLVYKSQPGAQPGVSGPVPDALLG